jgi:hypothetical protein
VIKRRLHWVVEEVVRRATGSNLVTFSIGGEGDETERRVLSLLVDKNDADIFIGRLGETLPVDIDIDLPSRREEAVPREDALPTP